MHRGNVIINKIQWKTSCELYRSSENKWNSLVTECANIRCFNRTSEKSSLVSFVIHVPEGVNPFAVLPEVIVDFVQIAPCRRRTYTYDTSVQITIWLSLVNNLILLPTSKHNFESELFLLGYIMVDWRDSTELAVTFSCGYQPNEIAEFLKPRIHYFFPIKNLL